jgi:uncharacterized protein
MATALHDRRGFLKSVGSIAGLAFVAPTKLQAQVRRRLSIATAASGSVFYPLGGAMAAVLSRKVPGLEVTAEMTSGVIDNMRLLEAGKVALALTHSMVAWDAQEGRLRGSPRRAEVRTLIALFSAEMHVVTLSGNGLKTVADFKGKRVSTGSPGSNEIWSHVLEAYGLTAKDFRAHECLGAAEAAAALKDRKIDAFFWYGAAPIPALLDLAATPGIQIQLLPNADRLPTIVAKHGPAYAAGTIPRGIYKGVDSDVPAIAGKTLLVTHPRMEEPLAYRITKVLVESLDELAAANRHARSVTLKGAVTGSPVPFHPGAERYYRERSIL